MIKLPKDIQNMEKRIAEAQKGLKSSHKKKRSQFRLFLETAFRVATEFVSPVIIALCIGYFADIFFNTKPILMLIMVIFGCVSGVLNVYRTAQELDKQMNKE